MVLWTHQTFFSKFYMVCTSYNDDNIDDDDNIDAEDDND